MVIYSFFLLFSLYAKHRSLFPSLSQYFLIWYANITEETKYFLIRNTEFWNGLTISLLVIGHFVLPFTVLLIRAVSAAMLSDETLAKGTFPNRLSNLPTPGDTERQSACGLAGS